MATQQAETLQGAITGNVAIAMRLRDYADLLEQQGEDGFRQRAYRRAAECETSSHQRSAGI